MGQVLSGSRSIGRWLHAHRGWMMLVLVIGAMLALAHGATAQEVAAPPPPEAAAPAAEAAAVTPPTVADALAANGDVKVALDTVWVLITAFLVFFMNTGFAMVESGLCRSKNTVNILAKNFVVFACASLAFLILGWGLMFGNGDKYGIIGLHGLFMAGGADNSPMTGDAYQGVYSSIAWTGIPLWAKFFFQLVFAGTAATIVSGAVAERIKFGSFIIFSFVLCGVVYPIIGHWIWGGGWLAGMGMFDFAGSTVVHSIGGWAALAGAIVLGPRLGKYNKDGTANAIPAHNMTSVCLGGLILWFGWFGFNPGSTMSADWGSIGHIAVTTNTAAAAATISAAIMAWLLLGKPDFSMIVNGTLAGLVAITAPCAFVSVPVSLLIGVIAGAIVVPSVIFVDRKLKIDDPVGALSVHLLNGVFGTLCVGLFADPTVCPAAASLKKGLFLGGGMEQLKPQLYGIVAVGVTTFVLSWIIWHIIKATVGLRVSDAEQIEGLDLGEHDQAAYPDFAQTFVKSYHLREM